MFKRTAAELLTAKTVAVIDVDVIAAYASAVADLEAVGKALDETGVVVTVETVDRNGRPTGHTVTKPNPLLKSKSELYGRLRQLADALGIGPVSRTRVNTAPAVGAEEKPNAVLAIRDRIRAARAAHGAG